MLLGLPDDIHKEKPSFLQFKKNAIRTDGRTDSPCYRDARTYLKTKPHTRHKLLPVGEKVKASQTVKEQQTNQRRPIESLWID